MQDLQGTRSRRLWLRFRRSLQRFNRLDELERMREKVGAGSRFAMVRGKVSRTIVRDTLRLLLRACGCGRARVGDFARAGGFRARRGISRAPGGAVAYRVLHIVAVALRHRLQAFERNETRQSSTSESPALAGFGDFSDASVVSVKALQVLGADYLSAELFS